MTEITVPPHVGELTPEQKRLAAENIRRSQAYAALPDELKWQRKPSTRKEAEAVARADKPVRL